MRNGETTVIRGSGVTRQYTTKMQLATGHYMNDPTRNKVAAYRHAYDCSNMTVHVVSVRATELFKHPLIAEAVSHLNQVITEKTAIDAAWVLNRLKLLADFNISKFIVTQPDGRAVYNFINATDDDWYCISEYTVEMIPRKGPDGFYEVEKTKLKANCRLKAIELIGKLTGVKAFSETVDVNALVGITQLSTDEYKTARADMLQADDC